VSQLVDPIRKALTESGYSILSEVGPFALVAQNESLLVFVAETATSLPVTVTNVHKILSSPFKTRKFGPKTLEMYCVLVAPTTIGTGDIERCEQDIRVCRKVVITKEDDIEGRLSFLRPLEDVLTKLTDIEGLFWAQIRAYLAEDKAEFLDALYKEPFSTERALTLLSQLR